jgi:hypothetical protein
MSTKMDSSQIGGHWKPSLKVNLYSFSLPAARDGRREEAGK